MTNRASVQHHTHDEAGACLCRGQSPLRFGSRRNNFSPMSSSRACARCGSDFTQAVPGVPDFSGHVPGRFDFARCEPCDAWWLLDPRTDSSHSELVPESYPTHAAPRTLLDSASQGTGSVRAALKWSVVRHAWGYERAREHGSSAASVREHLIDAMGASIARIPSVRRRVGLNNLFLLSGPPGRLLDVGCGNGEYLLTMKTLGWRGEGLEPDVVAARVARQHGVDVRAESVERAVLEDDFYDAATASHCLEHVSDPWAMLARLSRAVRRGGRIIVAVPNPGGAAARRFGSLWRAWDPPRHLVLLGARGLADAATQAGLRARVTSSRRLDHGTAYASLTFQTGRAPSRAMLARTMLALRLSGGALGGDELVLESVRP